MSTGAETLPVAEIAGRQVAGEASSESRPMAVRVAGWLAAGGGLLAGLPLWLWWTLEGAGYVPGVWLVGIPYLAAATLLLAIAVPRPALGGARAVALGAFALLAAWTWVAVAWSPDPGAGVLEAQRRTLYLVAFALAVLWPPGRVGLRVGVGAFIACALVGVGAGIIAGFDGGLIDGRLAEPALYPNAMAALAAMGAFAALVMAARPGAAAWASASAAAAAGALGAGALLAQSRGGVVATLAVAAGLVALVPFRLRLLLPLLLAGVGIGAGSGTLFAVRNAALAGDADGALLEAVAVICALAAGLAAAMLAARAFTRARPVPGVRVRFPGGRRAVRFLVAGIAVAVLAGIAGVALSGEGRAWVDARIDDFGEADYTRVNAAESRFSAGLGSNRSDYWRVSLDAFAAEPLAGAGTGAFRSEYLRERDSESSPRYAHGLFFGTAGELGVVGLLLLAAAALAVAVALWTATRRRPLGEVAVRVAAIVPLAYLAAHAVADWVGAFPALAVPALALAGAAISPAGGGAGVASSPPWRSSPGRRSLVVAAAVLALAALAVPMLVAERLTTWGVSVRAERPEAALDALADAARLNPLSAAPLLAAGTSCVELGRAECARERFGAAAERAPADWFAALELGLLARDAGDGDVARAWLRRAAALNPREPLVREALRSPAFGAAHATAEVLTRQGLEDRPR